METEKEAGSDWEQLGPYQPWDPVLPFRDGERGARPPATPRACLPAQCILCLTFPSPLGIS